MVRKKAGLTPVETITPETPAAKVAKRNGHIPQLKTDQQLTLSKIRSRALEHRYRAEALVVQARTAVDQANAADMEFHQVLARFAQALRVDPNATDFDVEKMQFKRKEVKSEADVGRLREQ